ncbi:large subunit ribosomal protein L22 [Haloferula luteola]|uniref:Large ribosomal subunit protein uL22 n=1 Tax=Haloferula luteola TaxID=595692 RepID=A0A840VE69_9BACT|nr:50S ribosomal protein L22 [Haloferula luteola]MBB5351131.1 large subunit ribosomal protein L22 [Haloferula luteola]
MEVKSTSKFVRVSPKKARDVAREIQGLPVSAALDILAFTPKKAAFLINKTLKTAVADAENNFSLNADDLVVKEAVIGAGPVLKRFQPRARGSAGAILKRTSHIFITLSEAPEAAPKKKRVNVSAKANA